MRIHRPHTRNGHGTQWKRARVGGDPCTRDRHPEPAHHRLPSQASRTAQRGAVGDVLHPPSLLENGGIRGALFRDVEKANDGEKKES